MFLYSYVVRIQPRRFIRLPSIAFLAIAVPYSDVIAMSSFCALPFRVLRNLLPCLNALSCMKTRRVFFVQYRTRRACLMVKKYLSTLTCDAMTAARRAMQRGLRGRSQSASGVLWRDAHCAAARWRAVHARSRGSDGSCRARSKRAQSLRSLLKERRIREAYGFACRHAQVMVSSVVFATFDSSMPMRSTNYRGLSSQ